MNDRQQDGGPNAPGAGPPPARLNPSPPKPRVNLVAVVAVLALVIGAGGLGVTAVNADKRRTIEAKEKIAEQKKSDARREDRSVGVQMWRDWADVTCQSVNDTSGSIAEKLAVMEQGVSRTQSAQQLVVLLGDVFTLIADFYRSWANTMATGPRPDQPDAEVQIQAYVAYFNSIADQVQQFAGTVRGFNSSGVSPQQAQALIEQGEAIDRTIAELPDAGDVYRGVDEAPVCQDVSERVETEV
jgi:hypothetical protein